MDIDAHQNLLSLIQICLRFITTNFRYMQTLGIIEFMGYIYKVRRNYIFYENTFCL